MRIPESLTERVFEITSEPDLVEALFPALHDVGLYKYAYALYLDGACPRVIFGYVTDTLCEGLGPGTMPRFRDFISANPPRNFADLVFLLDFYRLKATRTGRRLDPN